MNLRWYDRILMSLGGLLLAALGVCVMLAAGGVISVPGAAAFDAWLGSSWQWMPLVFLAGIVLIVWGLWLFIRPFRRGKDAGGKYYVLKDEAAGDVKISVQALDHLVHRRIADYDEILSAKTKISGREDAMRVTLHMTVKSDVCIPALIEAVRADIAASIENSAGVAVKNVQIYVDATKDGKGDSVKYLAERNPVPVQSAEAADDYINTASFYTAPIVITEEAPPEPAAPAAAEPTIAELKQQIDLGPKEPLPVDLSGDAFPFPEEDAGVPLEIYTADVPIEGEAKEEDANDR